MSSPYRIAQVQTAPAIPVPAGKRLPAGWQAFVVAPAGSGELTLLGWETGGSPILANPPRLRVTVALDEREEKLLEIYLPVSGRRVGVFDIRYAHLFQPFEIELTAEDARAILKEGCGLRLIRGEQPLWLFHDPRNAQKCPAFAPHLLLAAPQEPREAFLTRFNSLASLQFFGWQEGCVLDGLQDLARVFPGRGFEQTITAHLGQFFGPDGGLQAEDDFSRPADGRVYGIEATLPYAVLAEVQPENPTLKAVLDFWLAHRAADGSVADDQASYGAAGKALTAEGSYTLAYPMAVLGRQRGIPELVKMALQQLRIRRDRLVVGESLYLRVFADGSRSFRGWSRGAAWYLLGLARTLAVLPERDRAEDLRAEFRRAADWAVARQLDNGLWPCFLDEPDITPDSAGSAGIAAALALGARHNLLDPCVGSSARRALAALLERLTPDGFLPGVAQVNKGGEALQRGSYRVISQMAMGLLAQLAAAVEPPELVMGIDGGQTALKCALATREGLVLGQGQGRGLLHLAQEGGRERFRQSLGEAVQGAWSAAGLEPRPVAALVMGLTGVSSADTPEAETAAQLAGEWVRTQKIVAENDALVALKGAHAGGAGIICIAGTGAITLGKDRHGTLERAGGWGWLLGDEGSAFWIGREGLRAALRAQEGLGPESALLPAFQAHFQVERLIQVKRVVVSAGFGAQGFAALAPLVAAAAERGDPAAAGILRQAGLELAAAVRAVANRLDFGPGSIPVAPVGGAFEHFAGLRASFEASLGAAGRFAVGQPHFAPVIGAVIMARELASRMKDQELDKDG